jgi:hypothetical protein
MITVRMLASRAAAERLATRNVESILDILEGKMDTESTEIGGYGNKREEPG